ncbi:sulfotransferase [Sulfitobacter sp. S190]|uniref:sulfotransferase n=1 Tax=Sulfitobacter sp. S190 TaxID=2867022 RepID=UPI0021A51752|nr:sulfotransferase [Sulfitobacter sp. S190]UWR24428.1 sulfotransferase [Sulfitobacter sp. S190]
MSTKHLIIPGMAKAGTTFLFDQLARDTDVFNVPRIKELNYLTDARKQVSTKGYMELFPDSAPDRIFIDASPVYLQSLRPLARIVGKVLPDREMRFIITVRDPIQTMWSHYLHDLKSTICPIWRHPNPGSFSLFEKPVLKRYFKHRSRAVQGLCDAYPGRVMGLHMKSLFKPEASALIGRFLDAPVQPFSTQKVSNPGGWLPYFRYGGASGAEFVQGDTVYELPARALLLVSNDRSALIPDVDAAQADHCMALQSTFTRNLDVPFTFFEPIIEDYRATCAALGLEPDTIEEPARIVSEATAPVLPDEICSQLRQLGTLGGRVREVFKH